jgi:nucleotide-binding universal stress UspA family protein
MNRTIDGSVDERAESERQRIDRDDAPPAIQTTRLCERLLLPLAGESDAERTCRALQPHIEGRDSRLFAVHVIEQTEGYPDKAPYDIRREQADATFGIVHEYFAGTTHCVSTEVRYGSSIVDEILAAADAVDATAIGFTPRPGQRWIRLLAGDLTHKLVTTSRRPVVVFPPPNNRT